MTLLPYTLAHCEKLRRYRKLATSSIIAMRCQRAVLGFFGLGDVRSAIGCILSDWEYSMRIFQ